MTDLVTHRKALFQYELLDTLEVGIALLGSEVKSLRAHGGSLQEAYVSIKDGELWLIGASIAPYSHGGSFNHEERRPRRLLAHKKEILKLYQSVQEKGLTCIALAIYCKAGKIKVKIAIARGKTLYDKRESIKAREDKVAIHRAMKQDLA